MDIDNSQLLSILSLCIALLAVIVGPIVSLKISKHQSETSLHISNKQIIGPIKKDWVKSLQDHVAEVLSISLWFYVSEQDNDIISVEDGDEEREDAGQRVERKLLFIMSQIELMLDPSNNDHVSLLKSLKATHNSMWHGGQEHMKFPDHHQETVKICQKVLKYELQRVQTEVKAI